MVGSRGMKSRNSFESYSTAHPRTEHYRQGDAPQACAVAEMSSLRLRRKIFGIGYSPESSPTHSRDHSPAPIVAEDGTLHKVIPVDALEKLKESGKKRVRGRKRKNAWIFGLGGFFGVVLAATFATPTGSMDKLVEMAGLRDMHLDSILDVLPAGLLKDVRDLQSDEKKAIDYDSFSVGLQAKAEGISAKHPVIMIPGVISTGLESWGTEEHSRPYFRKRLWGSWTMMRALVMDKAGWKRHIMLDEETGMDPPGIKLRAAQGFDATDFFITGYWIWNKILENLATIGYDPNNAFTAAYDWRMSYMNYEIRDSYYTKLKQHIETAKITQGTKVVLLSHSMGSQVLFHFMHWVEAEGYGDGGPSWIEDHVEAWINISGCMLGALKDLPAVLSGEMRDTAQVNALAAVGIERFLSRTERAQLFRHMPGICSMLPIGGSEVWGGHDWAPDDRPGQNFTFGNFLKFPSRNNSNSPGELTVPQSLEYLWGHTEKWFSKLIKEAYSLGVAHTKEEVEKNQAIPRKWMNPLETRLPYAPSMKIYCFYGMGKPTERAYYYKEDLGLNNETSVHIDTTQNSGDSFVDRGVVMGEGDGTVNLMSSGYMCSRGWKIKRYNPAQIPVVAYEMPHEPDRFDPRGGPNTGDHVDILGRRELNDFILRVAGGKGHLINETIYSNIREYSAKVRIYDEGETGPDAQAPAQHTASESVRPISSVVSAAEGVASKVERLLDEL